MTYREAISEIQQRSVDALKVAQATQIASLRATRDFAAAFSAPSCALLAVPRFVIAWTGLTRAFAFELLEQQVSFAKGLTDALAARPVPARKPEMPRTAELETKPQRRLELVRAPKQPAIQAAPAPHALAAPIEQSVESATPDYAVAAPVAEAALAESPVAEAPLVATPVDEFPLEAPVTEAPVLEAAAVALETPVIAAPVVEETVAEALVGEAPFTATQIVEDPVAEAPVAQAPVAETPVLESPVAFAAPLIEPARSAQATVIPSLEAFVDPSSVADELDAAGIDAQNIEVLSKSLPAPAVSPIHVAGTPSKASEKPKKVPVASNNKARPRPKKPSK